MKTKLAILFVLLVAILLAACQPAAPTPQANEPQPAATLAESEAKTGPALAPTEPAEAYPVPQQAETSPTAQAYPSPEQTAAGSSASVLYPGPKDGEEVSWFAAMAMIMNGEVTQVVQSHSLEVRLHLRDGRTLVAYETQIDEVLKVIENCGEPCKDIQVVTE